MLAAVPESSDAPVSVVVVEDTPHVRRMVVEMLTLDGFDVRGDTGDPDAAADLVARTQPDVVVMDLQMPGTDGLAATRAVLAARPGQAVVLWTAFVDGRVEREAQAAGALLVLSKIDGLPMLEVELVRLADQVRGAAGGA